MTNEPASEKMMPVTHMEAREAAQRLINSHFRQEPHARVSIPARPDYDDDLRIMRYIEEQEARATPGDQAVPCCAGVKEKCPECNGDGTRHVCGMACVEAPCLQSQPAPQGASVSPATVAQQNIDKGERHE